MPFLFLWKGNKMYIDVYYKDEKDRIEKCYVKINSKVFDEGCKTTISDGFFIRKSSHTVYVPGTRIVLIKTSNLNDNEQCEQCNQKGDKCQNQGKENQEPSF